MAAEEKLRFAVPGNGEVSSLLVRPPAARWLLVLGHGAGAGMAHPFLEKLAAKVALPMLFLQGTRDTLADLTLLRPICEKLGSRGTLHIIPEADHSFHMLKKAGKADAEVMKELAQTTAYWADKLKN